MTAPWDKRIARAEKLAGTHPAAAELLRFYAEILRFQRSVYDAFKAAGNIDAKLLKHHLAPLLSLVARIGPPPLAHAAGELAGKDHSVENLLAGPETDAFFGRALFQPYKEYLAIRGRVNSNHSGSTCPFCGEKPQVGVLRAEGDGGKRSLVCSLCSTEWEFRRMVCAGCGEEEVDKLPVYTASDCDYIRIEACDGCQTYIKSVDLTKNGLAVPVVDELATVSLNVWADGHGYAKLQPNLLGM